MRLGSNELIILTGTAVIIEFDPSDINMGERFIKLTTLSGPYESYYRNSYLNLRKALLLADRSDHIVI